MRENVETYVNLIKKHELPIAFGVDLFGSPELLAMQNLELTTRAHWWAPAEVLQQATYNTGQMLLLSGPRNPYQEGPLGVIEPGAYADLLLVDGNPLEDLALLTDPDRNLVIILKDGVIYKNMLND